jgi:endonuclease-3 related protein
LSEAGEEEIQALIRPAGYYRQKTSRLRRLARLVMDVCAPDDLSLEGLRALPLEDLRNTLMSLKGIGHETADSILLYALDRPVFVVDAYTVRVLVRHQLIEPGVSYVDLQAYFEDGLPADVELFKDFHAQLVELGKRYCKSRRPLCAGCPVHSLLGDPIEPDEYL